MSSQYYLTTPLYYVNDVPHIGHAYTTILADVLARYQRLLHPDHHVHFLTGLDEHGQKVARAAAAAGKTPQTHCDEMAVHWKGVWERLNIRYDDFIRTTEPRHMEVVLNILNKLNDKGDIYRKEYEGWYSVYEERFFTEKDLIDGKDPIGGKPVEYLKESNYFFKMGQYQQWLIDHYDSHPNAVLPESRLNEVKGFLRQPLDDLCISRPKARLSWGIPIPWDEDYVTYVWFDALTNYYSATVHPPDGRLVDWPADYHLIGKDILTTHAVYWPIMLYAAGLEPPRHILAHGWWLDKSAAKMSKSGGNVVDPLSLVDKYGPDAFRYVLMRDMTVGQDANFSEESFIQRYNSDLANDLGNLYSRLAKLWEPLKHHWTKQPRAGSYDGTAKNRIVEARTGLRDKVTAYIDALQPNAAIDEIQQVVRLLNQTVEEEKAWKGMGSVFNMIEALETLSEVAKLLEPIMPTKMSELRKLIKPDGQSINPQPNINLFPRIQSRKSTPPSSPTQAGGDTPPSIPPPQAGGDISSLADLSDFIKLDIRIAKVVSAERAPNANKLLLLQVDIGEKDKEHTETPIDKQSGTPKTNTQKEHTETPIDKQSGAPKTITQLDEQTGAINVIQLVAGIGDAYTPEELVGRRIVVLVNLKPAVIRGHRSEGMLLAAGDDKALALLSVDKELPPGVRIR